MKFLSLFSGIEAASVAWNPLGWHAVAFCEIDPPQRAVLHHHYASTPNIGDITQLTQQQINELGQVDLVVGGFPCQDLSLAGARKGLKNADGTVTRSGLFYDAMRVAEWTKSRWLVIENVFGLLTSNEGRDFAAVVGEMAGCGFDVPNDGWRKSGVVAVGAPTVK
jgi:DNA (cytosine-5)-methyltransferase 1